MPQGASPARRGPEWAKAGRMLVVKSCQRGDHSTSSLGASWSWVAGSSSWRTAGTVKILPQGSKRATSIATNGAAEASFKGIRSLRGGIFCGGGVLHHMDFNS